MRDVSSGCILVVDDEESVRALTARVLRRAGYRVVDLAGGAEAMAYFQDHAEEISLVLLDVMMPSTDGLEVLRRMRALRPAVPAVALSGFLGHGASREDIDQAGFQAFLSKPFAIDDLLATVARHARD